MQTADGYVVLASETGVVKAAPSQIVRKGRLQPGKIFLVDLEQGRIVEDEEVKAQVAGQRPVRASGTPSASSTSTTCPTARRARRASSRCAPSSSRSATRRRTCGW